VCVCGGRGPDPKFAFVRSCIILPRTSPACIYYSTNCKFLARVLFFFNCFFA
jgi:hypothetical protein